MYATNCFLHLNLLVFLLPSHADVVLLICTNKFCQQD